MNPVFLTAIILFGGLALVFLIAVARSLRIVPAKTTMVVERLGKFTTILEAGFHILMPFVDKIRYKFNLREIAIDVSEQSCFTLDNVKVMVDGVLYMQIMDSKKAAYGITNCTYATIQLAQTTMRSVIGRLELDKTFEERDNINATIVKDVDEASDPWGVRVTRYEIKNISVPNNILKSMELQVTAERVKRAEIARSLGEKESKINTSLGIKQEAINKSEGEKTKLINEAEGRASEILAVSRATAQGIRKVAAALQKQGGDDAVTLQLTEGYIRQLKKIAKNNTKIILPMDLTDFRSVKNSLENMLKDAAPVQ